MGAKETCLSKAAYWKKEHALGMKRKREKELGIELRIYSCEEIGKPHYHLTKHTPTTSSDKK